MNKYSRINELIQKATQEEPFDSFYEWDSFDKIYDFPVYRLHIGSKIFVWKLEEVNDYHDKDQSKKKELVDSVFAELIALHSKR